jgi:pyruvate formate lyase activating enzyme
MCPFCQNWELIIDPEKYPAIPFGKIKEKLEKKKGWVDGVVFTGGEPLFCKNEVFELAQELKKSNIAIKIDTNGAFPETLGELIDNKLIDYVAMDVKAPLDDRYYIAAGKNIDINRIKASIELLLTGCVEYEFRTTCVPGIINKQTVEDIGNVIKGAKKWALQAFVPENAFKKEYRKELGAEYYSSLKKYHELAQQYVVNVVLRGKTEQLKS